MYSSGPRPGATDWFEHRDPRGLAQYNVRYQSEAYDEAMREYGDAWYAGVDIQYALACVMIAMEETTREKHRAFVQRSVC